MSSDDPWQRRNLERLPELDTSRPPILVLGLEPPSAEVKLEFAPGRDWFYVCHQTAGICCKHEYLYATALTFRPEVRPLADKLARSWIGSHAGCVRRDLDEVVQYRAQIQLLGVDCRYSFPRFQEAYYPIDPTPEALRRLAVDDLPEDLDELLVSETHLGRTYSPAHAPSFSRGGWQLVILGENFD